MVSRGLGASTIYKVFWGAVNSCCEVDGVFLVIVRGF